MRLAAAGILLAIALLAEGCVLVVATASAATDVAATAVTTAGKVTVATVKTGGKIAVSTVSSSGDMTALTIESAARLSRTGMVVAVDAGTGAVSEIPWRDGMRLAQVMQAGRLGGTFRAARIFRHGAVTAADLASKRSAGADWPLWPGDVVEFRH